MRPRTALIEVGRERQIGLVDRDALGEGADPAVPDTRVHLVARREAARPAAPTRMTVPATS